MEIIPTPFGSIYSIPWVHDQVLLKKGNILVGEEKGSAPGIFLTDPGLAA